ncbi:MAG: polysaccharide deacetylase [Gemmobacter sp.]|nr:polysaccharide deacetylase [Gemmobacter sp.]
MTGPAPHDPSQPWLWPEETWRAKLAKVRAGRSLMPRQWKGGARMAVALSFDSDHETFELKNGGTSIGKMSQGQYGARRGIGRVLAALERHAVPASFFMPAVVAMINPDEVRSVIANGHEIALHSWIHEFNSGLDHATERDLALRAAEVLEKLSGVRPVGMRTASWDFSPHTLAIAREMGLLYDSSLMADDEPYELLEDDEPTGIVEIPVEWIRDDAPYVAMDRMTGTRPYGSPTMVADIFARELDMAWEEGGLFQLTMHPHHIGHRSRMFILEDIIRLAKSKGDVWFCTHADLARYCADECGLATPAPRA